MLSFLIKKLKYKKQPEKVVKAIILKNEELEHIPYALLGLENETGKWKFIGGGVEKNEDIKDALFREVLEETGLALTDGNIDGEPYEYDVNGKKIYVYFIKHNGDLPNPEGDIDQEFKKLDWFPVGMIVKGKLDLAFPANENVCVKAIMDKYKDFLSTRENIQIDEVQTDETNNKLSFKEKRELTKKLFELKGQILQTKDFKTKRKLTKDFFNLRDKILGKSTKQEESKECTFKFDATSDTRKAHPYVAKIVLKNGKLDREFFDLNREYSRKNEVYVYGEYKVKNGDIVEKQIGGSWKNKYRYFYYVDGCEEWFVGSATSIESKRKVIKFLNGEIGVDDLLDGDELEKYQEWEEKDDKTNENEEEQSQQTESQEKDEIIEKTKEILSKDDISLDDLNFFTSEVLVHLDLEERKGTPEIKELEKIVKEKIQELESQLKKDGIDFDEIELMFDSAEGEKLSSLFEKMFALRKAKSKKNDSDKLKAFKELQKLIETDPDIRDMLEVLIEDLKAYTDDVDSVSYSPTIFEDSTLKGIK